VSLHAEEQGSGPSGPGDETGDFRQALVSGTLIFVAVHCDSHDMGLILPLSDKAGSGFVGRNRGDLCRRVLFHHSGNLGEAFAGACAQSPERLFLDPVGQDTDYEMPTKLPRRSGLK